MIPYRIPAAKSPTPKPPKPPWLTIQDVSFGSTLLGLGLVNLTLSFFVTDARPYVRFWLGTLISLLGILMTMIARHDRISRGQ